MTAANAILSRGVTRILPGGFGRLTTGGTESTGRHTAISCTRADRPGGRTATDSPGPAGHGKSGIGPDGIPGAGPWTKAPRTAVLTLFRMAALALILAAPVSPAASGTGPPVVVASIKPVHSLVAMVMAGVAEAEVIVAGGGSPHGQNLKPSQAARLQKADLVFWIGPDLERFLAGPIDNLAGKAIVVQLAATEGLTLLDLREGGVFSDHDHEGEDHDHGGAGQEHEGAGHEQEGADHDHGHGPHDMHVWLDPMNAKVLVTAIATALASADPANRARYLENAAAVQDRLDTLVDEIDRELEPVRGRPYVVFHDGYRYFENRFGLPAAGTILVNPDVMPGARRIAALREQVSASGAVCVFAEPQFRSGLADVIAEGSGVGKGVLDPIGAEIAAGPEHYFTLITNMAAAFRDCLDPSGGTGP